MLSIGQLCDDNCWGLFNKKDLLIFKKRKLILRGKRNLRDGLWDVHLKSNQTPRAIKKDTINIITKMKQSNYELANFFHGCLFSPTVRAIQQAISNDHLITWPGIKKLNFNKYTQDITATELGHMNREKKNLQSTKITQQSTQSNNLLESPSRTYQIMSKIIPFTSKEMAYGDLTGAFPFTSTRGSKYIYLMYDYDANAILVHPWKSRQAAEITAAWTTLHKRLTKRGHIVSHFVLDNEISTHLKKAFAKNNITYQAVPPNTHRANAAERAIQTFKQHFYQVLLPVTRISRLQSGIVFCNNAK